ncbi:hypothetical protein [Andreprevotia chitinilytica]|uniref:hypothetical protein n=1 Tax=Andreprevotia chitinilytica TaxID=396808 RepID=UPI0005568669|nr:hypothetical protein [Andreprevotia chitinilytica]
MELPSPAVLFAGFLFSLIGFIAFRYGKKQQQMKTMIIGIALMVYPYFVPETWMLYLIGVALCAGLYVFRGG